MVNTKRDTALYTAFGQLVDRLCREQGYSFHRLAAQSGMKSHAPIVRACQGKSTPTRAHLLAWCDLLHCTPEERAIMLHSFGYATPEELETPPARGGTTREGKEAGEAQS